ncbi:hypothetical protein [Qipengyuania sp. MTN3-11]|uniref:hypothetical protein n=1 Tax=Qipengyuania sp. MTN3-11 TaxID=3056557 RepID=UPI0036F38D3C
MRGVMLTSVAALALGSTLALAQDRPADLLPPGFDQPAPTPTPSPTATRAPQAAPSAAPTGSGGEVIQPLPPSSNPPASTGPDDLSGLPTLEELESLSTDELDELLGLRPRFDIPPAARRSTDRVGVVAASEGGMPPRSLARQPARLVRAVLAGIQGPVVSRWGHILLRRALASRLAAPQGMDPVYFAALRARALNGLGEFAAARALVQDVDTQEYSPALTDAAIAAYIGTSDIVGACPAVRLADSRDEGQWRLLAGICSAYAGDGTRAQNDLRRALNSGEVERIDALLAQRYAGAAGQGRRAVTIEWDAVEGLSPWRFALANALGEEVPEALLEEAGPYYRRSAAMTPALTGPQRVEAADVAAAEGILSSRAMVDLYSQIYAEESVEGDAAITAARLREAYVAPDPAARLAAIRDIWGGDRDYGRFVLTAYAAARLDPREDFAGDAGSLIASMLTAGLERDALRWSGVVEDGSEGWALLLFAQPGEGVSASDGDFSTFLDDHGEEKARMLLAGLAGLERIGSGDVSEYSGSLGINLGRQTRWTQAIDGAARAGNPTLVALLAGLGMQGASWDRMTALHLFHIVRALAATGMEAEARMIAAEAVARA